MSVATRKITIHELLADKLKDHDVEKIVSKLNFGTFGECHTAIFKETGIWVPELVPVFQRLDALLAFRDAPSR
ncbi:MAG: hypothetical protein WDN03_11915 [Rhizomicrobium sp.]